MEIVPASMGGEDFYAFQQAAPGAFFLVDACNEEEGIVYPHHHPGFTIDESALSVGVRMFVGAAVERSTREGRRRSEQRKNRVVGDGPG